jgi:hypothetical protein
MSYQGKKFRRHLAWHGMITADCIQGLSRDLIMGAMKRAEAAGLTRFSRFTMNWFSKNSTGRTWYHRRQANHGRYRALGNRAQASDQSRSQQNVEVHEMIVFKKAADGA